MKIAIPRGAVLALMAPLAALSSEPPAPAGEWLAVADSASQVAFLDTASLESTDRGLRATVKINYTTPQTYGKQTYQSARNVYIIDCGGRRLADKENAIYAGSDLSGKRVSHASRKNKNLVWRNAAVASIDGELLTSACRRAPQGVVTTP